MGLNENSSTTNCYSAGQVNGTGDYIGGFIGYNSSTISSNFWDIDFSGTSDGVGNQNPDPTGVMGKTTTEMQISHTFISVGWDFTNEIANGTNQIWQMPSTEGYPVLSNFNGFVPVALNGNGSEINPWKINDAVELGTIYHYRSNACYELTSDIDLSSIQWSSAVIPMFKGSFYGTGYTIFNLNIDGGGYLGLLGYLGSNATVIGLGL